MASLSVTRFIRMLPFFRKKWVFCFGSDSWRYYENKHTGERKAVFVKSSGGFVPINKKWLLNSSGKFIIEN